MFFDEEIRSNIPYWNLLSVKLEVRLAAKEEQALEKDLIFEQVDRLTQEVYNKVGEGKEYSLTFAKQVCLF